MQFDAKWIFFHLLEQDWKKGKKKWGTIWKYNLKFYFWNVGKESHKFSEYIKLFLENWLIFSYGFNCMEYYI